MAESMTQRTILRIHADVDGLCIFGTSWGLPHLNLGSIAGYLPEGGNVEGVGRKEVDHACTSDQGFSVDIGPCHRHETLNLHS